MVTRRNLLKSTAAAAAIASFLPSFSVLAATPDEILVVAQNIDDIVNGFDPAELYELTNFELCGSFYRSLVVPDPADSTQIIGDLAEKWDVSADGSQITFHLRDGVKFESGNPVTAEDAAFSLIRVMKIGKGPSADLALFGWTAENIEEVVQAADERTLVLTLKNPVAPGIVIAALTAHPGIVVDKKTVMANEKDNDLGNEWLRTHSAGAGPYRLVEWRASDSIILEANPNAADQPKLKRIVIRAVKEPATQLLLVQKGDVDIARNLGADQLNAARADDQLAMTMANSFTQFYLGMNVTTPELTDINVRQAIKWAIDYDGIANTITRDTWDVSQSFVPIGIAGRIEGNPFSRNPEKAKEFLAKSAYPNGFKITLDHSTDVRAQIAQVLQTNLADIGITVDLMPGESSQVVTKMRARQHQLVIGGWGPHYADADYNAQSFCVNLDNSDESKQKSPAWRHNYVDAEFNDLVQAAARELDAEKRIEMYLAIQKKFLDEAPFAFLLQERQVAVHRKNVTGLQLGSFPNLTRYTGIGK